MINSIPASEIVKINPGVISAGGSGLELSGLFLTNSLRAPMSGILSFENADDVATFFGSTSLEAAQAETYFRGYVNSFTTPGQLLIAPFATAARSGWLLGNSLGLTLAQLTALPPGVLTLTVGGAVQTSTAINLAPATSFSNAASIIQSAFTSPAFSVAWDSVAQAFRLTTTATGAAATITFATGTFADPLGLSELRGAILSQGAAVSNPTSAMDSVLAATQNWASFTTLFKPADDQFVDFARWTSGQDDRFLYAGWTDNLAATQNTDTTSPMALVKAEGLAGTAGVWSPVPDDAVFVLSYVASLDFRRTNGRATAAFRRGTGLTARVTNATVAANLQANGYSFYGTYATANDTFTWLYNGQVSGDFQWIDSYVNQIWLNNQFQLSWMTLLGNVGQIPYNDDGYELIRAGLLEDIETALSFGAIRAGVDLSEAQKAIVKNIAGRDITDALFTDGWFLVIQDPGAQVRAQRGSPICTFIYTDGQSVQKIVLSSLMVQ